MDVILRLFDFTSGVVFVGFGEGVYRVGDWLAIRAKCLEYSAKVETPEEGRRTTTTTRQQAGCHADAERRHLFESWPGTVEGEGYIP